ncbi:LOW QUALITY PROTEIN: disintegrin and metalloproteinase domain-containing protein 19 [Engraulis encrasicolus]|uniref:LOW QUALITY PROTEIN: disintegrin and metalloproteinase domain-containing protein 19 n=1 Tax=Engraulis encrasicolus TaxID=184585 RepID=UPI002FD1EBBB
MIPKARATRARRSACLYLLLFLFGLLCGGSGEIFEAGENGAERVPASDYELTYPRWVHAERTPDGQDNTNTNDYDYPFGDQHPSAVAVWIAAEGQDLLLKLQKNHDLLTPGFQEIWYSPDGTRHSTRPHHQDHCFYHGFVDGWQDSSVALSTCSGLRGVVSLNASVSYIIEPLANQTAGRGRGHALLRAEKLRLATGNCPHHHDNQSSAQQPSPLIGGMAIVTMGTRERRDISRNMKYVELLLVADYAEFLKRGPDIEKVKATLLEVANYVDKYYKSLGVRVALTGVEVWSGGDQVEVSVNPFSTLSSFLTWRRRQLPHLPNDNAQLITGKSFLGSTIGLAPLKAMCSDYQSGGVNSDHSESVYGVAATLAHELGHNFGMNHDSSGCCQADPALGGCIMAAATGSPFPRVFNRCNEKELRRYLSSGGGKCLFNPPDPSRRLGGAQCGNGYLEEGEECDCGLEEECSSECCHASNCTLKAGAECAHGVCCHNCKLRAPGEVCRAVSGSCDLPEFCDGVKEACPDNFFLLDGSSCARGGAYCYTGMCLTLQQQCLSLWGPGASVAPEMCFTEVNRAGDQYGNCGKDTQGNYRKCSDRDARCGKIQCLSSSEQPVGTNAVVIPTNVNRGRSTVLCKGTHVYQPPLAAQGEDTLDPGLVMTGTRCAEDSICFSGECRNVSFLGADECSAKCNGHGRCNNRHHCHCDAGWAPPFCSTPGEGGSVDSGPVVNQGALPPVLLSLLLLGLVGLAVVAVGCRYKLKLRPLKTPAHPTEPANRRSSVPNSKCEAAGHANPTFQLKNPETPNTTTASPPPRPGHTPSPRSSVVRPTVKPPPVPAYARNTHAIHNTQTAENTHAAGNTHAIHTPHTEPGKDTAQPHHQQISHTPKNTHAPKNTDTSPTATHIPPKNTHIPPTVHPSQKPQRPHPHATNPPIARTGSPRPHPPTRPPPLCPVKANQLKELRSKLPPMQNGDPMPPSGRSAPSPPPSAGQRHTLHPRAVTAAGPVRT